MGRKAKARNLIRRALLRGEKGWSQLLIETGLAKGALSMNLRQMQKEREVVYEQKPARLKTYKLSDQGLIHASVSAISTGVSGQIAHVLEKIGRNNPSGIKSWIREGKNLSLEIEDPSFGKLRLTLHPSKQAESTQGRQWKPR